MNTKTLEGKIFANIINSPNFQMFYTTNVLCYIILNKCAIKHLLTSENFAFIVLLQHGIEYLPLRNQDDNAVASSYLYCVW